MSAALVLSLITASYAGDMKLLDADFAGTLCQAWNETADRHGGDRGRLPVSGAGSHGADRGAVELGESLVLLVTAGMPQPCFLSAREL